MRKVNAVKNQPLKLGVFKPKEVADVPYIMQCNLARKLYNWFQHEHKNVPVQETFKVVYSTPRPVMYF
jgi:hypothetical protein